MDYLGMFVRYEIGERGLARSTVGTYLEGLKRMERFTGKPFTHDLSQRLVASDLRRFFRDTPWTPGTKRSTLSACKQWERFGGIEEWWTPNGILALQAPLQRECDPNPPLSLSQVSSLLGAARKRSEARLCYLGLFQGCRVAESGHMGQEHYLGDRWRFIGKGGKRRDVPMHPETKAVRRVITLDHLGNGKQLQRACETLRERVGFHFHTHQLRDTFAQRLLDLDVALPVVESLLGHSHKSMTLRAYASVPFHQKMAAIEGLHY